MCFIMGAFCPQFTVFLILPLVATNAILYLWLGEQNSWLSSKPTPLLLHGLVSRSAVWAVSFFSLETEYIITSICSFQKTQERKLNWPQNFSFLLQYTLTIARSGNSCVFLKILWSKDLSFSFLSGYWRYSCLVTSWLIFLMDPAVTVAGCLRFKYSSLNSIGKTERIVQILFCVTK